MAFSSKAKAQKYYKDNKDDINAQKRRYRASKREQIRAGERDRRHNLQPGQYDAVLTEQNGGCAICTKPPPDGQFLCVDHDHACCFVNGPGVPVNSCGQCFRGLLCHNCNQALGKLNDDPALLTAAIEYLKRGRRRW